MHIAINALQLGVPYALPSIIPVVDKKHFKVIYENFTFDKIPFCKNILQMYKHFLAYF